MINLLEQLHKEEITFWKEMLMTYFINSHKVIVRGMPSIKKQEELAAEEKDRVQKRKDTLGNDGLKKKAMELLNAKVQCEVNTLVYLTEIYILICFYN